MATSNRVYTIDLGSPTTLDSTITILESGSQGTPGARRILTHPDDENFPALVYYRNPDEDFNLDNDVLVAPLSQLVLTEGTTKLVRHGRTLTGGDGVVTEVWAGGSGRASMPTSFFRLLLEYLVNPPPTDPINQTYITWQPRDKNAFTYNVEIVSLFAGRGRDQQEFHVKDVTESGGGGGFPRAIDGVDPGVVTGLLAEQVTLVLHVVGKVAS